MTPVIQRHPVGHRKKGVDLEGTGSGSCQLRLPVTLDFGAPAKRTTIATFDDCRMVVKINQRGKATLFTSVDPINDYSDRIEIETALAF